MDLESAEKLLKGFGFIKTRTTLSGDIWTKGGYWLKLSESGVKVLKPNLYDGPLQLNEIGEWYESEGD